MTNSMVSPRSAALCGFHPQPQGPGARSRCRTAPASRLPPVVRRISAIITSQSCRRHVGSPTRIHAQADVGHARSASCRPSTSAATVSPHRREFITRTPVHGHGHDLATPPGAHHQNPGARARPCAAPAPPGPHHRVRLATQHQRRHTERAKLRSPVVRGGARRRLAQVALPSGRDAVVREPRRPTHQVLVDRATRPAGTSPPPGRREDSCAAGRGRPAGAEPPPRQAGGRPDDRTSAHAGESGREAALPMGLLIRVGNTTWMTPQRDRPTRGDPVPRFPASSADAAAGELSVLGALAPDASTDPRR
jgi:hypothetical protein